LKPVQSRVRKAIRFSPVGVRGMGNAMNSVWIGSF
jgi:2-keto-3-deoxy-L-rhamnonate aldolase RhmA